MAYKFGTFVWFENSTDDIERTKAFYTEILGWGLQAMKMGDGSEYTMLTVEGRPQAGIVSAQPGGSPRWTGYLSVEDVDAAAAAAPKNGGSVLVPPMSIPTVGRFSIVADPLGGVLAAFKGEQSDDNASSAFHWNELWTPSADEVLDFYTKTFQLGIEKMAMPGMDSAYLILKRGEAAAGGVLTTDKVGAGGVWTPFIAVEDTDAVLRRAEARKAKVVAPAMDVPNIGRFAVIRDPSGAQVGIIRPAQT